MLDPFPEVLDHSRKFIASHVLARVGFQLLDDLVPELLRYFLVGVNEENPIVVCHILYQVLLANVAEPVVRVDPVGVFLADFDRIVRAMTVNNDDFVGPGDALQAASNLCLFIERGNAG